MKSKSALVFALMAVACAARADATSQTFTVSTTFTPACVSTGAAPTLNFGAYTAFGSAATSAPTGTISFRCSRALTLVSAVFDSGADASAGTASATPTGAGVIAGLQYTLTTAAAVKSTTGAAATPSSVGTADVFDFVVTGAMASGQAGCVLAGNTGDRCSASQTRTLTLTY